MRIILAGEQVQKCAGLLKSIVQVKKLLDSTGPSAILDHVVSILGSKTANYSIPSTWEHPCLRRSFPYCWVFHESGSLEAAFVLFFLDMCSLMDSPHSATQEMHKTASDGCGV